MIFKRKFTRQIKCGSVLIGGDAPISVQTMTKTKTSDAKATIAQIISAYNIGADIVRVTVNDNAAAMAMEEIVAYSPVPIVADIHFNHVFALQSISAGVAKVRINPGNIGSEDRIKEVLTAASQKCIPIRIGVNSGSLDKEILAKYGRPTAEALYDSAMKHIEIAQKFGFEDLAVSVKSSDVKLTIQAYSLLSERTDFPLHLGVTEAGSFQTGTVKSSVGIGALLAQGIGDTIRVSLTDNPEKEIEIGKEILRSLGLRSGGIEVISCPTCGRTQIDMIPIAQAVEQAVKHINKNLKIAVMGCAVNGPGEAKEADIGIAAGNGEALLFKKGETIGKVPEANIIQAILDEIEKM